MRTREHKRRCKRCSDKLLEKDFAPGQRICKYCRKTDDVLRKMIIPFFGPSARAGEFFPAA